MTDSYPVFTAYMKQKGFVSEHKFLKDRKFRFDYAHTGLFVAFEVDGGLWMAGGGRHNRPTGFLRDLEKMNLAVLSGWAVLKITPDMIKNGTAHLLVEAAMVQLDPAYITEI